MLFSLLQLSCFDKNLTIYYDTQSKSVTLNAWFSEALSAEELEMCEKLDETYFLPRILIGSATFSTAQALYSLRQPLELELQCDGADYSDPLNECNKITDYSAATFEFEFPDFPLTLTDTISYYFINLFNHRTCLHKMRVNYNYLGYSMSFVSQTNDCYFMVNGTVRAALVDKDLNVLHEGLTTVVPASGNVSMSDLDAGELQCPPNDISCQKVFSAVVADNFRNELIELFIPMDLVYHGEIYEEDVSLLLSIDSIDPTSSINCFEALSVEIMDNALKFMFQFYPNCSDILKSTINGKTIDSFVETINIYIAGERLTLTYKLDALELDKAELIQSCRIFENPAECLELLRLAINNDYETYFTVQYMHGEELLDSFIYTSSSQERLCFYQPVFTLKDAPCVSMRATGACVTDETYSTRFAMKLRSTVSSEVLDIESHINYPNKEEMYCFIISDEQTDELMAMLSDSSNLEADLYIGSTYYLINDIINNAPLVSYRWVWAVLIPAFILGIIGAVVLWRLRVFNLPALRQEGETE